MPRRIVVLSFEKGETSWQQMKGDEEGWLVAHLVPGEQLCMEVKGLQETIDLHTGLNTFVLEQGKLYKFVKTVPEGQRPSKTCVEVLTYGSKNVGRTHADALGSQQNS